MVKRLLFLILLVASKSWGLGPIDISELVIECGITPTCDRFKLKLQKYVRNYENLSDLKNHLKLFLFEDQVFNFEYKLFENEKSEKTLEINFDIRKVLDEVKIQYLGQQTLPEFDVMRILGLQKGDEFDREKTTQSLGKLKRYFEDKGYPVNELYFEAVFSDNEIDIVVFSRLGEPVLVSDVEILASNSSIQKLIREQLIKFIGTAWDSTDFKLKISRLSRALFNKGYFFSKLEYVGMRRDAKGIVPQIQIILGDRYSFGFKGNTVFNHQELLEKIRDLINTHKKEISKEFFKRSIVRYYENVGLYNTKVVAHVSSTPNKETGGNEIRYFIDIEEGHKIKISQLKIKGINYFTEDYVEDLFYKKGSVLVNRGFYDEGFSEEFTSILKREYHQRGFIFFKMSEPRISFDAGDTLANIFYRVNEGIQTLVRKIEFRNLPDELKPNLLALMHNKENLPLNTVKLGEDLSNVLASLRQQGYYFAKINNMKSENVISYFDDYKAANILIDVDLQRKVYIDEVITVGLVKTKRTVVEREVDLDFSKPITPNIVQEIRDKLSALGVFSSVQVRVIENEKNGDKNNLLINVKEKKFGYLELAPGFRTDIGLKFSSVYGYNNLWGMNRSASLRAQVNQRLNFDTLDTRRRSEERKRIEYSVRFKYSEPYIMGLPLSFQTTISNLEKRFFSFDAQITRVNLILSKEFSRVFSASLKYQYEYINQFDATELIDNDDFKIGGLTPSVSFDFRNNRINPTSGSFFSLSCEFANPTLGSQDKQDLSINFYKLVSRSRFYLPMPFGTLALSLSVGKQENLAKNVRILDNGSSTTQGYIPSIKLFRLNGIDIVRGFDDDEINRLDSGEDINSVIVRNEAYFTNIKIEPRYAVSDEFIVGLFLDGGKVFVDHFKPASMRTSAGVSLKYLTPVGSIDFDYGFKLRRKRVDNSALESPGRFHLSIGFF